MERTNSVIHKETSLVSLLSYGISGAHEVKDFADITRLASEVCQMPVAIISLEDNTRKWFKTHLGITVSETPSEFDNSLHAFKQQSVFELNDSDLKEHLQHKSHNSGDSFIKCYAAIPLVNEEGFVFGYLGVMDYRSNELNDNQEGILKILAGQILNRIEYLKKSKQLSHIEFTFDNALVGIAWLNVEGAILKCNKQYQEFAGYSDNELDDKYIFDLDSQFTKKNWKNYWKELQQKKFLKIETQFKTKEGHIRDLEIFLSIHYIGNEEFADVACNDITERKVMERKYIENIRLFKESEIKSSRTIDLLEELQNIARIGYWELDLENNKIFWSDETRRIHEVDNNYTPQMEEGINFYDEKSKPIIVEAVTKAIQTGNGWNKKLKILTAEGNRKWVRSVGKLFKEEGKPMLLYGLFADISEEVESLKKIARSQEQFKLLAENTSDTVALHKLDGTYTYISPACKTILGYEPEEVIGKKPSDFLHPDDVDKIQIELDGPVISRNESVKIECRIRTKNGDYKWFEVLSKAIVSNSKPFAIITSSRDITERVEIQTELFENYKSLEIVKEEAVKASNAKKVFLTTMSHEIRTPLNAINGLTHLLLKENPREDQIENLKLLRFSGENLLTLINDVLDISKIDSGKLELSLRPFDLAYLLNNIQRSLSTKAKENHVDISIKYDEKLPTIFMGDGARISQILYNLVGNAIKFTKNGKVTILTSLLQQSESTYKFRIGVKDTGIGIPKEYQTKIFNSFEQADNSISRQYGGTGLGLYISAKLVELMNSTIQLDSIEDMGSYFYFDIQLKEESLELEDEQTSSSKEADFAGKNIQVLVAEDNPANQMIIGKFLQMYKVDFDIAENGKETVDKIKSKAYNFVLMDLQMPVMDGLEATREIRKLQEEYFKKVPIIALTADVFENVKSESLSNGMNDYLSKPFRPNDLINTINKYYSEVEHLLVKDPILSHKPESKKNIEPKVNVLSSEEIEEILKSELPGNTQFQIEFLRRCNGSIVDFLDDIKACVTNKDLKHLKIIHHNIIIILKFFRMEVILDNLSKLIKEGEDFVKNKTLISTVINQVSQINKDFKKVLEKHK